jgi:hypothetical protein
MSKLVNVLMRQCANVLIVFGETGSHLLRSFGETLALLARRDTHFIRSGSRSLRSLGQSLATLSRIYNLFFPSSRLPECTQCMSSRVHEVYVFPSSRLPVSPSPRFNNTL